MSNRRTGRAAASPRRFRSSGAGEWPPGIYWSPGEERTLPEGYPIPCDAEGREEAPPAFLKPARDEGGERA